LGIVASDVTYMLFVTYAQAAACLAYIRKIARVTCQLVDSPLIVGWGVVSGWFYLVRYAVAAFIYVVYVLCINFYTLSKL